MELPSADAVAPSMERSLVRDSHEIDQLLCDFYAEQPEGALIDQAIEYDNPSVQFRYVLTLAHIMGGETEEHFVAAYSSYHFAISLAKLLGWQVPGPHAAMSDFDYLPKDADYEQARELMISRADAYLADRPEVASVVGSYVPDYARIPNDALFDGAGQVICALTLERIEQYGITQLRGMN